MTVMTRVYCSSPHTYSNDLITVGGFTVESEVNKSHSQQSEPDHQAGGSHESPSLCGNYKYSQVAHGWMAWMGCTLAFAI